jgi:hypothetical protein
MHGGIHRGIPRTADGRPIMLPSTIGDAEEVQFAGTGDDVTNGVRCSGSHLQLQTTVQGLTTIEWQFIEWVSISGGRVRYSDAIYGDCFSYEIEAPATVGTSNPGGGWYDKVNLGGSCNIYVPNPTQTGDWDLSLTEKLNENVDITKVTPVPAAAKDGYFDWDQDTYAVTLNTAGKGSYYLFDFDITLTRVINAHHILGNGTSDFIVPASYGAKLLLPHYIHKFILDKADNTTNITLMWELFLGRLATSP